MKNYISYSLKTIFKTMLRLKLLASVVIITSLISSCGGSSGGSAGSSSSSAAGSSDKSPSGGSTDGPPSDANPDEDNELAGDNQSDQLDNKDQTSEQLSTVERLKAGHLPTSFTIEIPNFDATESIVETASEENKQQKLYDHLWGSDRYKSDSHNVFILNATIGDNILYFLTHDNHDILQIKYSSQYSQNIFISDLTSPDPTITSLGGRVRYDYSDTPVDAAKGGSLNFADINLVTNKIEVDQDWVYLSANVRDLVRLKLDLSDLQNNKIQLTAWEHKNFASTGTSSFKVIDDHLYIIWSRSFFKSQAARKLTGY